MIEINYEDGVKVVDIYPNYTLEEQEKANQLFLQKLYDIFFNDNK